MASRKPNSRPAVRHPSHNHHCAFQARDINEIICSGCGLELTGQAFQCTKSDCDYFLHKSCFDLPREINHKSHPSHPETMGQKDHEQPLTLLYNTPYKGREDGMMFMCDVCEEIISENVWVYYCKECDYGTHVHSCEASRMKVLMKAQDEMQLQARIRNEINISRFASWSPTPIDWNAV